MNKNSLYIPSLKPALPQLLLFISSMVCLFISVLIMAVFLFLEYFCGFEYFSLVSPFTTEFLLVLWFILLLFPTIKRVCDLLTVYYVNENGEVVKYSIIINSIENFKGLVTGAIIGARLDKIVGHGATGFVAMQNLVRTIMGISHNTNKAFVLGNIENEEIYKVKKVYGSTNAFKPGRLYKNINEDDEPASVSIKPKLLKYTSIITLILILTNIVFTTVAVNNNAAIKSTYTDIQQTVEQKLSDFRYQNKSTKLTKFERHNYSVDSVVSLDYDYTGKLRSSELTEVDVYWDFSEKPDYILCELKTIFDILELDLDESKYANAIYTLQSKESGFTEKSGEYGIYLTKSGGKINLRIHS